MTAGSAIPVAGTFRDVSGKPFNACPAATRRLNRMMREEAHIAVSLPIARLIATQATVNADFRKAAGRYGPTEADLPAVVKYLGGYYVTDGHHRIMSLAAEGETLVRARLFDLDGDTQGDFPLLDGPVGERHGIAA